MNATINFLLERFLGSKNFTHLLIKEEIIQKIIFIMKNLFETLDTSKPQEDSKKEEKNVNAIPNNPSSKGKNSVEQRVQKMNYISGNLNKK